MPWARNLLSWSGPLSFTTCASSAIKEIEFEGRPAVPYSRDKLTEQVIQCFEWRRYCRREGNQVIVLISYIILTKERICIFDSSELFACSCHHIVISVCYVILSILCNASRRGGNQRFICKKTHKSGQTASWVRVSSMSRLKKRPSVSWALLTGAQPVVRGQWLHSCT